MIAAQSALVVIDPYNDFLSPGGKGWLLNRATIRALDTNTNLERALKHCRDHNVHVCYAPHAQFRQGLYERRQYLNPSAYLAQVFRTFRQNSWGGRFRNALQPRQGDFVASEHLVSSGFVGTDLHDHLSALGITDLILCGCLSNTCVESTARSAIELGYRVTILQDALAAMSLADHDAAIVSGFAMCAHQVISVDALINSEIA